MDLIYAPLHVLTHVLHPQLTPERIQHILKCTAEGMAYLHSFARPVIHRDLKSHNLLVDKHWNVKIADFGLSKVQDLNKMTATGTPQWSAPEVIRNELYDEKVDVYSFGVIIYELLTRKIPYANLGPMTACRRVAFDGLRPDFPKGCSKPYVSLAYLVSTPT